MLVFEKLSNDIGSGIADKLNLDKDKREIITYGAYIMLDVALCLFMVIVLGLAFNVFYEAMVFSFTTAILRKYSGGAHSTTSFRCATIGAAVAVGFALVINSLSPWLNTYLIYIFMSVAFLISYLIVLKLAPKDSPSKPIVKETKIRELKIKSIRTLHAYVIICLAMLAFGLYYKETLNICIALICSGALWQAFTLTSFGHSVFYYMEAPFRFIKTIGGEKV